MQSYQTSKDNAEFNQLAPPVVDDPRVYSSYVAHRWDAKYGSYRMWNEILKLQDIALKGGGALKVRNETGVTLNPGAVRVVGWNPTAGAFLIEAATASGYDPAEALLLASLAHNTTGAAFYGGPATAALDTSGAATGDAVYLSTSGGWTLTPPSGADQIVQEIGRVESLATTDATIMTGLRIPQKAGTSFLQDLSVTLGKLAATSPSAGKALVVDGASSGLEWGSVAVMFSDAEGNPADVATASADGTSAYPARRDHVHTLAASAVGLSKIADVTAGRLLGRATASGTGAPEEITPGQNLAFNTTSLQVNLSATDKILGRVSSGAGGSEEIACTAAGRALLDDASASAQRATLNISARNAVINGDGIVKQRSDYTLYGANSGLYGYATDRFAAMATGTAVTAGTATQGASPAGRRGLAHKLSGVTLTGSGLVYWRTRIEAKDALRFVNQAAYLSCRVRHDTGGNVNFTLSVRKPTDADNFAGVTDIATNTTGVGNDANTALSLAIADMGDCSNGIEIEVKAAPGAITTKNFWLTEVQLEEGTAATPFEYRPYAQELVLCQRYAFVTGETSSQREAQGIATAAQAGELSMSLPVPMRVAPTLTVTPSGWRVYMWNVGTSNMQYTAPSALTINVASPNLVNFSATWGTYSTTPGFVIFLFPYGAQEMILSAEL